MKAKSFIKRPRWTGLAQFFIMALPATLALTLTAIQPVQAATLTVCASGCEYTTVANAIAAATPDDTISVLDAVHTEVNITIDKNLTVQGQGPVNTTVSGGEVGRVFLVNSGVTATIRDMTISNGSTDFGGGIYNFGTLTINNCTLTGNFAARQGGGIQNDFGGTLTINHSTLSENVGGEGAYGAIANNGTMTINYSILSDNNGGAIGNNGTLTVNNSTLSGNSGTSGGGAIATSGTLTVNNSTLSGNSASSFGGAIGNAFGTLTVNNSTLYGNSAPLFGAGIVNLFSGRVSVKNTIIAASSPAGNCGQIFATGPFTASGANMATDGTCPGFTEVTPAQLNLGPLAANSPGTTATHALLTGSVAIDATADCTDFGGSPVTTDQRGVTRPQGTACDIGAYEVLVNTPPMAQCQNVTVAANAICQTSASVNNGSFDPDGDSITLVQSPAGPYGLGSTSVQLTVTDSHDASAMCSATVKVVDQTSPAITCPANIVAEPTSPAGAVVTYTAPVGTDNCTGAITTKTAGLASGATFPIGTTVNAFKATDTSTNMATCSFTVQVLTPTAATGALNDKVQALVTAGVLTGTQGAQLTNTLNAAISSLNRGATRTACNQLRSFINDVNGFVKNGTLSLAQAQPLINSATNIRNTIGC